MRRVESFGVIPFQKEASGQIRVLLILHHQGNHWGFPKGKANGKETSLESATRELKEETGLEVAHVLSHTPVHEEYQFRHRGEKILKIVHYFPAFVAGDLRLQAEEVRDAKWLSPEEAMHYLTFKEARLILQTCLPFCEGQR